MTAKLFLAAAALLASAVAPGQVVLGRLAQTSQPGMIYAAPNTAARIMYRAKANEYLVVQPSETSRWYSVLLSNGVYAYVKRDQVSVLNYIVRQKAARGKSRPSPSRGGVARTELSQTALAYIGTPYKWGGNDINNGIDCSAFVKNLFGRIGSELPRTAADQAKVGQPVLRLEDLREGDRLYFWDKKRGKIGHTGLYLGGGYFVHSSRTHQGVATDYLGDDKWRRILVAARR